MQSFTTEQIIRMGEEVGFTYEKLEFSIVGNYRSNDSLFNHRDIPHFNHLHANLAGGYGNEGIYYGEVVSFIRYFKFLGISFPILTLMKDDGKNRVLETFSFACFQFLKLNEETDREKDKCLSKITYFVGAKNSLVLKIFLPFFKKMFNKSFNDYKNDDWPYLNRRGDLRKNGFSFNKDNINSFRYDDTLNIKKQNCFYLNPENQVNKIINISLDKLTNNEILKIGEIGIMGFQLYRKDNLIKIYPRVCPHEGGDLDINNEIGVTHTKDKFIDKKCRMRCNIHNRFFDPIVEIDITSSNKNYSSNVYDFILTNDKISINLKNKIDPTKADWSI